MSAILDVLHQEHIQVSRLLDLLSAELEGLDRQGAASSDAVVQVMHYMTHYPDLRNHPREDLLFERLVRRGSGTKAIVASLVDQHVTLARDGKALLRAAQSKAPAADVVALGAAYVDLHRAHMNVEEGEVFPLARVMLGSADWAAVDAAMVTMDDPVFGSAVDAQYDALRRAIER